MELDEQQEILERARSAVRSAAAYRFAARRPYGWTPTDHERILLCLAIEERIEREHAAALRFSRAA